MTDRRDFLIETYRVHSADLARLQSSRDQLMRFALIGTFGLFGLALSSGGPTEAPAVRAALAWLPAAFNTVGLAMAWALFLGISRKAAYLRELERAFLGDEGGWECRLARGSRGLMRWPMTAFSFLFWIALAAGSIAAALAMT